MASAWRGVTPTGSSAAAGNARRLRPPGVQRRAKRPAAAFPDRDLAFGAARATAFRRASEYLSSRVDRPHLRRSIAHVATRSPDDCAIRRRIARLGRRPPHDARGPWRRDRRTAPRRVHVVGSDRPPARSRDFATARSLLKPRRATRWHLPYRQQRCASQRRRNRLRRRTRCRTATPRRNRFSEPGPAWPRLDAARHRQRPGSSGRFGEALDDETLWEFPGGSRRRRSPSPASSKSPIRRRRSRAHREDTVLVWAVIDPEGAVEQTHVVEGTPEFAAAVEAVLSTMHFIPAHDLGRNIRFYVTLEFDFRIEGAGTPNGAATSPLTFSRASEGGYADSAPFTKFVKPLASTRHGRIPTRYPAGALLQLAPATPSAACESPARRCRRRASAP